MAEIKVAPCICVVIYNWECPHCKYEHDGEDLGEEFTCPKCKEWIKLEF